jgi:hypothetical protein
MHFPLPALLFVRVCAAGRLLARLMRRVLRIVLTSILSSMPWRPDDHHHAILRNGHGTAGLRGRRCARGRHTTCS